MTDPERPCAVTGWSEVRKRPRWTGVSPSSPRRNGRGDFYPNSEDFSHIRERRNLCFSAGSGAERYAVTVLPLLDGRLDIVCKP
jgi:hypothetical protein